MDIEKLIKEANERYEKLSPEEKALHDYEQRRSFVRGQCPFHRNYEEWCKRVDRELPPKQILTIRWCNTHQRESYKCLTEGGIMMPCDVVDLTGLIERIK